MFISLHKVCNQNCIFCSSKKTQKLKKSKSIQNVPRIFSIAQFKSDTAKNYIQISGGEPFLSPQPLLATIRQIKKKDTFIELQTNATLIEKNKNILHNFLPLVNVFNVNFSAHNSKLDFEITGLKNAFLDRVRGVQILLKNRANVRLTFIINKKNYRFIRNFVDFVSKQMPDIRLVQFSFVKLMGAALKNDSIITTYNTVKPFLLRGCEQCKKKKIDFITDHIPLCFLGPFITHAVDYQKICRNISGNHFKEKKKIKGCAGCLLNNYCAGPRKDYVSFFGAKAAIRPRYK